MLFLGGNDAALTSENVVLLLRLSQRMCPPIPRCPREAYGSGGWWRIWEEMMLFLGGNDAVFCGRDDGYDGVLLDEIYTCLD